MSRHRISSVVIRVASGFSTFILTVMLSGHYNSLGPNINPGELRQFLRPIVIAKTEIPLGSRIIPEQLVITQLPHSVAPDGTFAKIDGTVIGRVAATKISAREPITESRLAPVGSTADLSRVIPEGYHAMTIRVDEVVTIPGKKSTDRRTKKRPRRSKIPRSQYE